MKRKAVDDDSREPPSAKRTATRERIQQNFRGDLFEAQTLASYTKSYADSQPYKHGVINSLIAPDLLRSVRTEIQTNISFTPKETDIYKIHQSGDLANLDGLDDSSLALLPSLVTLRDALYSPDFRRYLEHVTESGPLSGRRTDMAVNVYTPGCHLLCHDDVIGSRRVSYILYLTDPDRPWRKEWGGALRLYPTTEKVVGSGKKVKVPDHEHTVAIPPAFGQLSFFAVQPGESYHDVEEVYARPENGGEGEGEGEDDDGGRVRMAISGWYHIPQEGEDGYEEGAEQAQAERSSLAQLQGKSDDLEGPQQVWIEPLHSTAKSAAEGQEENLEELDEEEELTEADLTFLLRFMNPRYLVPDTVAELSETFIEGSSLRVAMFLNEKYAATLRSHLASLERSREEDAESPPKGWETASPPYKHRYQYLQALRPSSDTSTRSARTNGHGDDDDPLELLTLVLFPSLSFRKWLALATSLTLTECSVRARRFRRGKDYTLATAYEDSEPQLEVCLGVTPTDGWGGMGETADELPEDAADAADGAADEGLDKGDVTTAKGTNGMSNGRPPDTLVQDATEPPNVGGYEAYMAGDDDNEAPESGSDHGVTVPATVSSHTGAGKRRKADPAVYKQAGDGDEDDGVLFSAPASFNMLSLVLRDQGTLKFVKYVSQSAKRDRWDVSGAWKVDAEGNDSEDEEA